VRRYRQDLRIPIWASVDKATILYGPIPRRYHGRVATESFEQAQRILLKGSLEEDLQVSRRTTPPASSGTSSSMRPAWQGYC
jgi:hypothetical protein